MRKRRKGANRYYLLAGVAVIVILAGGFLLGSRIMAQANNPVPGSSSDPLVAKSYLDKQLSGLTSQYESLKNQLTTLQSKVAALEKQVAELKSVISSSSAGGTTASNVRKGIVTASLLNLRNYPSTSKGKIVAQLPAGTVLTVYMAKTSGDWYYVSTPAGKYGYVYKAYVKLQ
ncbi:MAG: hypothetical protein PWQ91_1801 [Eubacteriales bacterium]|nr:hypothetical protein [Eubacteriales bacterium]MDN5364736.1 hypothetical protein [Eubacteriales bacterium]